MHYRPDSGGITFDGRELNGITWESPGRFRR
jgi:hypothetical protein